MNNPELEALRKVDELDTKAAKLRREIADVPRELEKHKAQTKATAERVQRCHDERQRLQREIDKIDLEMRANAEQVRKFQQQQNGVKTNEEYAALTRQIDAVKKASADLEDRALAHYEAIDALKAEEGAAKKAVKDAEDRLGDEEAAVAGEARALERELEGLLAERKAAEAGVPSQTLALYRRLLEKLGGRALAPVRGRTCQGCFLEIPPNMLSTLLGGKEIVQCKQCMRILYLENEYRALSPTSFSVSEKDRDNTSKDGNW